MDKTGMVKKVADAIRGRLEWFDIDDTLIELVARAAIEAMRDLPLPLYRVGEQAWVEASQEHRKKMAEMRARLGGIPSTECVEIPFAWRAIIDAILEEKHG